MSVSPSGLLVGVTQEMYEWHPAGHGAGVTQKGHGWHLVGCGHALGVPQQGHGGWAAGCPHPDMQRQAAGALAGGAAQAGGLQHVAAAPVAQEAPGVEVHLVARRLEVEGHCGDSGTGHEGG